MPRDFVLATVNFGYTDYAFQPIREPAIRFLIVEDDLNARAAIIHAVSAMDDWQLAGEAGTLAAAAPLLLAADYDLLLVDLMLPDGSGHTLISQVRSSSHQPKIVVISVFGDEGNVIESIQRGADGYMLKGGDPRNIAEAVEQVMAGMAPISPAIAGHMLRRIRKQDPRTNRASAKGLLTPREVEILNELAKGLTYRELGEQLCISHHTVNDHLKSIYRKLAVNSRVGAIYQGMRSGYVEVDSE
jgi:DNA-binding NarL/FixJ family response regulator